MPTPNQLPPCKSPDGHRWEDLQRCEHCGFIRKYLFQNMHDGPEAFAWLVEILGALSYRTVGYWDGLQFIDNVDCAIRYARKEDADRALMLLAAANNLSPDRLRVAQHGWC